MFTSDLVVFTSELIALTCGLVVLTFELITSMSGLVVLTSLPLDSGIGIWRW